MIRLAVTGLLHEANTFSSQLADLTAYLDGGVHAGADLIEHYRDSQAVPGGFLEPADPDVELLPLPVAYVTPRGPVSAEAFDVLVGRICDELAAAGPVDGVLLVLHGAAVAEGRPAADAEIAERVREVVGPEAVIGTTLDMHANVDQRLVDAVDVMTAYQTNPHVDAREKAVKCRRLVLDVIRSGRRPALVVEQLPLVVTIVRQDTGEHPMAGLLAKARELETEADLLDLSLLEGFPYADTPQMGMSVIAMHADRDRAANAARRLAEVVWSERKALQGNGIGVAEAMTVIAEHHGDRPLLVLDVGDNIGAGGPGDSTIMLAEALRRRVAGAGTTLDDPDAVRRLADVEPGDRVDVLAGGRSAEQDGMPVRLTGVLVGRHRGTYEEEQVAHGGFRFFDAGEMLGIRTDEGVLVVLTSKVIQPVSPAQYRAVGIDPDRLRAHIAKGVNGPRAGYARICAPEVVVVDSPGVTRNSVTELTYRHRRIPMYPYESSTTYSS
ncbi:M81 family metallopeptidase [Kribbella sp.]|uniref:M81 family metallopeptidase n=1 Tax=Kribbella sp. TaxID=1871183 RepID=UPI002D563D91|nr:M81 family metallopeptidase [Kribbella sp.]HZX07809.1 M81 family metallopeptidase [Kribbella sp.]